VGPEREGPPRDRREADRLLEEAKVLRTKTEWQRARAIYERVAKGRYKRVDSLLGLAEVAWQEQDNDGAIDYATQALAAGGGDAARLALGNAYLKKERFEDAIAQYNVVVARSPHSKEAREASNYLRAVKKRKTTSQ
jgi:tetratricopeptide (TPR) repeat protein